MLLLFAGLYIIALFTAVCGIIGHKNVGRGLQATLVRKVGIPTKRYQIPAYVSDPLIAPDSQDVRPVFILVHGFGGAPNGWRRIVPILHSNGALIAAPWMAGHGESPRATLGFGPAESDEVVSMVQWVRSGRPKAKIVLVGVSMGGAACLLAAAKVSPEIAGVVVESSFPVLSEATDRWFGLTSRNTQVFQPLVWTAAQVVGVAPESVRPIDAASKLKGKPGLIICDLEDKMMPESFSDRLAAAGNWPIWKVPGASHATASRVEPERFAEKLLALAKVNKP
ncbi:MAG: alpha/beta fold hydrolase [Armatimonadetes bacterium]|nr:alpha/beta fold hydrolase [Armatimonadota bacterium]